MTDENPELPPDYDPEKFEAFADPSGEHAVILVRKSIVALIESRALQRARLMIDDLIVECDLRYMEE